ncbi:S8 family peptidase [Roseiconus nitratireducens]|uniref:S8 family peptidase n=2 Tax=Roseiconus nitratireducens TaxID=2605748 RepID=A0A5M6CVR5_9BACT|nr:S8 family peptidase [Roseiconus nitratireducens]
MDPHLQKLVAQYRTGTIRRATVSTSSNEVSVIARVSDVEKWEELSEVRVGATINQDDGADAVVTGRLPISRLGYVRTLPFVKSLKAARPLFANLSATTDELNSRPHELPGDLQSAGTGRGTVVGVVDYGCDFAHQNFRSADGSTRLLAIWDQSGPDSNDSPFGYGRVHDSEQINAALQSSDPYTTLGYGPTRDLFLASPGTHGTHVMDIAAGNGNGTGVPGVAPEADLVFVDVSHSDLAFSGGQVVGQSFGDSTRLLEALKFIFDLAGDRPCVINVSLGTNGGPHDGTTLVEDGIDRLVSQKPNRAVTIAASNSYADGIHAAGTVRADSSVTLTWQVATSDSSHNELEIWYSGSDRFEAEIIAPDGTLLGRITPGGQPLSLAVSNRMVVFASNRLDDPNNHDNMIGVFLEKSFPGWDPAGDWQIRLLGTQISEGAFHAWVERDNVSPSRFAPPHDSSHTIGSISCGQKSIVVGSYDAHKSSRPLSFFSSAGPTRDGRQKPELAAPGHSVLAAHSRSGDRAVRKSGTSMAAPAVAGVCSLVFSEAAERNLDLSIDQLRTILEDACRRNPPFGTSWDDRYGHGRLSARRAIEAVVEIDGANGPATSRSKKKSGKSASTSRKTSQNKKSAKGKSRRRTSKATGR